MKQNGVHMKNYLNGINSLLELIKNQRCTSEIKTSIID